MPASHDASSRTRVPSTFDRSIVSQSSGAQDAGGTSVLDDACRRRSAGAGNDRKSLWNRSCNDRQKCCPLGLGQFRYLAGKTWKHDPHGPDDFDKPAHGRVVDPAIPCERRRRHGENSGKKRHLRKKVHYMILVNYDLNLSYADEECSREKRPVIRAASGGLHQDLRGRSGILTDHQRYGVLRTGSWAKSVLPISVAR